MASLDDRSRGTFRLESAHLTRFQHGAQHALRGDTVPPDELTVAGEHAAEVLRPWAVGATTHDDVADPPRAQLLGLWREREHGIDPTVCEELYRLARRMGRPVDVLAGIEAEVSR